MKEYIILIAFMFLGFTASGQTGFELKFVPFEIEELPPLHAYAFAQHDGKWLIIGGRTGQEEESSYLNYDLMVVDPIANKHWIYPLEMLGVSLEEPDHLGNCYAAYSQQGEYLYIAGGMGYSSQSDAFGSFPYLTIVDVPKVMDAIINKKEMPNCFFQVGHEAFARQDALLTKIGNYFYLAGGRNISGDYNEEGNLDIQEKYANDVFSFYLNQKDFNWEIIAERSLDYNDEFQNEMMNASPQVFPDGEKGLTVFLNKPEKETAALNWMNVFDFGYSTYANTETTLAHFHSTVIPVLDPIKDQMHTLFIGGCDEYFCGSKERYAPNEVMSYDEFVRYEDGDVKITRSGMDAFMARGRDAQFILNESVKYGKSELIDLSKIEDEATLVGYVYGGATTPGMMIYNDGSVMDKPVSQLFKVYLSKTKTSQPLGWYPEKKETSDYIIYVPLK